jgi:gamma-glutamyltranspeptidase/glutathione hydrolase
MPLTPLRRAAWTLLVPCLLVAQGTRTRDTSATGTPASRQPAQPKSAVEAQHGMVVSASSIASTVGRDVLAAGGNAVDAAVATAFALAVTYPTAGNIGGGGFMVIRLPDGRATTIDFREKAPAAATPEMFTDSAGAYSSQLHHNAHRSVGVPGTVAGLALAHEKYGKARWASLVGPAATLAERGFAVPAGLAASLSGARTRLSRYPATLEAYYRNGEPYAAGDTIVMPDLAKTLGRIRDQGRNGFYAGTTAALIAAEMRRGGGLITEADLAAYRAVERAPVKGTFHGYEIISMPPPSSGGVAMIEMLNILEGVDLKKAGHNSPQYLHWLAESMRRAFRDRAIHLGDPDFTKPPVERLTSKAYAEAQRRTIDPAKASPSSPADVTQGHESDETTHFSVVDKDGMAVSVTYTLEAGYGLGAVVDGAGFLLNNEMGDFNGKPGLTDTTGLVGTRPNLVQPGKRMLSSMTPTIVAKDGKLVAVVGSPGGRTIINTVLQVVLNLTVFDKPVQEAVNAPRMHHQWLPNRMTIERTGMPQETVTALQAMGHDVRLGGGQGTAHSIAVDPKSGKRYGAADPRDRDAGAVGH